MAHNITGASGKNILNWDGGSIANSPLHGSYQRLLIIMCGSVPPPLDGLESEPSTRYKDFVIMGTEVWEGTPTILAKPVGAYWDEFLIASVLCKTTTWDQWCSYFCAKNGKAPQHNNCYIAYGWNKEENIPIHLPPNCRQPGTLESVIKKWFPFHMQALTIVFEYKSFDEDLLHLDSDSALSSMVPSSHPLPPRSVSSTPSTVSSMSSTLYESLGSHFKSLSPIASYNQPGSSMVSPLSRQLEEDTSLEEIFSASSDEKINSSKTLNSGGLFAQGASANETHSKSVAQGQLPLGTIQASFASMSFAQVCFLKKRSKELAAKE